MHINLYVCTWGSASAYLAEVNYERAWLYRVASGRVTLHPSADAAYLTLPHEAVRTAIDPAELPQEVAVPFGNLMASITAEAAAVANLLGVPVAPSRVVNVARGSQNDVFQIGYVRGDVKRS